MALLIRGKTICGLCSKRIGEDEEVTAIPPLTANPKDRLFRYNDSVFHARCAEENADFQTLARMMKLWERRSAGKISFLSGKSITDPNDFFAFPYLGDSEQLAELNFRVFSKADLAVWPGRQNVIRILEELESSGAWSDGILSKLIAELKSLVP